MGALLVSLVLLSISSSQTDDEGRDTYLNISTVLGVGMSAGSTVSNSLESTPMLIDHVCQHTRTVATSSSEPYTRPDLLVSAPWMGMSLAQMTPGGASGCCICALKAEFRGPDTGNEAPGPYGCRRSFLADAQNLASRMETCGWMAVRPS